MAITCAAPGCSAKKESINSKGSIQFHRFPLRRPDVLGKWVKAMKNPNFKPTATTYLCSAHFSANDYDVKPTNLGKHLKSNAVPSVFEKRRPGRKKKIVSENTTAEDPRDNEEECKKNEEETVEEEYLDESPNVKAESNLAEIIGDQEKGTLHVLIVGEDGKITNSEYIFKKEPYSDEEYKQECDALANAYTKDTDDEDALKENINEKISRTESISGLREVKQKERIKHLENSLLETKNKMRLLQVRYRRMSKKMNKLKTLLKLLVLKRGKGEKNLRQLLEDQEEESEEAKDKVKDSELLL